MRTMTYELSTWSASHQIQGTTLKKEFHDSSNQGSGETFVSVRLLSNRTLTLKREAERKLLRAGRTLPVTGNWTRVAQMAHFVANRCHSPYSCCDQRDFLSASHRLSVASSSAGVSRLGYRVSLFPHVNSDVWTGLHAYTDNEIDFDINRDNATTSGSALICISGYIAAKR
jgi:hypothetical protein